MLNDLPEGIKLRIKRGDFSREEFLEAFERVKDLTDNLREQIRLAEMLLDWEREERRVMAAKLAKIFDQAKNPSGLDLIPMKVVRFESLGEGVEKLVAVSQDGKIYTRIFSDEYPEWKRDRLAFFAAIAENYDEFLDLVELYKSGEIADLAGREFLGTKKVIKTGNGLEKWVIPRFRRKED